MTRQYGHWTTKCDLTQPNELVGFIYLITHKATGKKYIGRKNLVKTRRKQVKLKSDPTRKKTQVVKSESDWLNYTSSSVHVNEAIRFYGKEAFLFEILSVHTSLSQLSYEETRQLILQDSLTAVNSKGERLFWNCQIPSVRQPPK